MNVRQLALVGIAVAALGGTAVAQVAQPGPAVTPPPPPAPNGNAATPGTLIGTPAPAAAPSLAATAAPRPSASPSPAPAGRRGRGRPASSPEPGASPSETPEPPQFQTLDGVWEVQLQPLGGARTVYSHLAITQKGDTLSGTWNRTDKEKLPFTGTFDGRLFKLTVSAGTQTYTMSGYAENFGDMIGLLTTADPKDKGVPFTASHRKRDKIT
ncbi:MAG: hypothetical protein QOI11_2977 [Candidatus Eremiobacteraeota bacterium]|nr:hypothetical protein [Candidatus Eremiobacteraeota bacterium]